LGIEAHILKRYLSSNSHTKPLKEVLPNHGEPRVAVEVVACSGRGPREDYGLCKASPVSVEYRSGNDHSSWISRLGGF
jgi:hypothetical protein